MGTWMENCTVSIQNVASILIACAFGPPAAALPTRKAMLSVPPPTSGAAGWLETEIVVVEMTFCDAMWLRRIVLGSFSMACVIVPAAMKEVRSCGIRGVSLLVAVWLGNVILLPGEPMANGVMSTAGIVGFPGLGPDEVPWASTVVPCG